MVMIRIVIHPRLSALPKIPTVTNRTMTVCVVSRETVSTTVQTTLTLIRRTLTATASATHAMTILVKTACGAFVARASFPRWRYAPRGSAASNSAIAEGDARHHDDS